MERRKVQEVGGGTYTVSLPSDWAASVGIDQGDILALCTHVDGFLTVRPRDGEGKRLGGVSIDVSGQEVKSLEQVARTAYVAGYESATFRRPGGFTSEQRRALDRVVGTLAGADIVDDSDSRMTMRVLLDSGELSTSQLLRQLQFVVLSLHADAVAALTGEESPQVVTSSRDQVDRLCAMIERAFQRTLRQLDEVEALGRTRPELFVTWTTAHELDHVADHATRILSVASDVETDDGMAEVRELARQARTVVEDAVDVVIGDRSVAAAREALAGRDRIRDRTTRFEEQLFESRSEGYRLARGLASIRRTAVHGGNVAERALLAAIQQGELREESSGDYVPGDQQPGASAASGHD